jgi:hypothetical protein
MVRTFRCLSGTALIRKFSGRESQILIGFVGTAIASKGVQSIGIRPKPTEPRLFPQRKNFVSRTTLPF